MIFREIVVGHVIIYLDKSKEDGYVSLSTDSFHPQHHKDDLGRIIRALRACQTDEDREAEAFINARGSR